MHVFVQARYGSTRLPGKSLMKLNSELTMLDSILWQISFASMPDVCTVVVCPYGDPVAEYCRGKNVCYFEGNENDVLKRFVQASDAFNVESIVRITADCPFIGIVNLAGMMALFKKIAPDFLTNVFGYPDGNDIEIFSLKALKWMDKKAKDPIDREHVTTYIKKNMGKFQKAGMLAVSVTSPYRDDWFPKMSVDTQEDFNFAIDHLKYLENRVQKINKLNEEN